MLIGGTVIIGSWFLFRFIKMRVGNLAVFHKERPERFSVLLYLGGQFCLVCQLLSEEIYVKIDAVHRRKSFDSVLFCFHFMKVLPVRR